VHLLVAAVVVVMLLVVVVLLPLEMVMEIFGFEKKPNELG
jgi:hypothetical protein